jgi:hypothetical protein
VSYSTEITCPAYRILAHAIVIHLHLLMTSRSRRSKLIGHNSLRVHRLIASLIRTLILVLIAMFTNLHLCIVRHITCMTSLTNAKIVEFIISRVIRILINIGLRLPAIKFEASFEIYNISGASFAELTHIVILRYLIFLRI